MAYCEASARLLSGADHDTTQYFVSFGANEAYQATAACMVQRWKRDVRRRARITVWVERGSVIRDGILVQIGKPTGQSGTEWLSVVYSGVQSAGAVISCPFPVDSDYGFGVLLSVGSVLQNDVLRWRCDYE